MADRLRELFGLDGQAAVVIGGTGVLCGRMAVTLAAAGAKVVVAGRSPTKGAERVAEIVAASGAAHFEEVDVESRESIAALCERSIARHGKIDILINGAGVNSPTPYFEIDDAEWDRIFASNLRGTHQACQIFGRHMAEAGGGSIVNVASISSLVPLSRVFAYSASKAALVNYTQNVARELASKGVRANCVSPGFIPAEQNRKILDADRVAKIMARTPMARFGDPSDLDGVLLLLASAKAGSFITGVNFVVDGGFAAMSI